jgi:hypothetical protein
MRGRVALPPLGLTPLGHYFDLRGVPLDPRRWTVDMPLVATLDREERISSTRLWAIINQAGTSLDCGGHPRPDAAPGGLGRKAGGRQVPIGCDTHMPAMRSPAAPNF